MDDPNYCGKKIVIQCYTLTQCSAGNEVIIGLLGHRRKVNQLYMKSCTCRVDFALGWACATSSGCSVFRGSMYTCI